MTKAGRRFSGLGHGGPGRQLRRLQGFTLMEVMIVVLIIALLITMVTPSFIQIMRQSRLSLLAHDLRLYAEAFETYATDHAEFPRSHFSQSEPPGMEGMLPSAWVEDTPIGGIYTWRSITRPRADQSEAYIQIVPRDWRGGGIFITPSDLEWFDRQYDDGDSGSGMIRLNGTRLQYFLDQRGPN